MQQWNAIKQKLKENIIYYKYIAIYFQILYDCTFVDRRWSRFEKDI